MDAIAFYCRQVDAMVADDWGKIPPYIARGSQMNIAVEQLTIAASMLERGRQITQLTSYGTPEQSGWTHAMGLKHNLGSDNFGERLESRVQRDYPADFDRVMQHVVPWIANGQRPARDNTAALISFREPICDRCPHELIENGVKKCAIQKERSPLKAGELLHPLGLGNPAAQCPDDPPRWKRISLAIAA